MKFKPGDRVRVFHGLYSFTGRVAHVDRNILELVDIPDRFRGTRYHEKQCRKLVKRKRRRIWVNEYENSDQWYGYAYLTRAIADKYAVQTGTRIRCTEFIEARPKKERK